MSLEVICITFEFVISVNVHDACVTSACNDIASYQFVVNINLLLRRCLCVELSVELCDILNSCSVISSKSIFPQHV